MSIERRGRRVDYLSNRLDIINNQITRLRILYSKLSHFQFLKAARIAKLIEDRTGRGNYIAVELCDACSNLLESMESPNAY